MKLLKSNGMFCCERSRSLPYITNATLPSVIINSLKPSPLISPTRLKLKSLRSSNSALLAIKPESLSLFIGSSVRELPLYKSISSVLLTPVSIETLIIALVFADFMCCGVWLALTKLVLTD